MSTIAVLPGLTPESYRRHPLHGDSAAWPEKNCYADLWIGFLHTLGLEPLAMLAFTVAVDFEGDQWTFFKPPLDELRALFGVDVQELTVWRPLVEHAKEHLAAGKLISTESDAFWLPDTAGTDYRRSHTKTTILLADLDLQRERLGYFHNAGYYELAGEDFRQLFRLDAGPDPAFLPLFAEVVRIDRIVRRSSSDLSDISFELLRKHFAWRPRSNPFSRFAARMLQDLPALQERGLAHYHQWAFASIRQAGAAFELLAAHLRWLATQGYPEVGESAQRFEAIGQANKTLILKGARAVNSGRALNADDLLQAMAADWERGMALLGPLLAEPC
ncbi:MAG TPA: DUF1839 family protein [Ramlibacter sp.]|jgi:hypothetical protein|uniref:DUF1839 family protein n=1 Tax=Ramlibacter sp. TaxID=1917967 RepID=UPI002D311860|nr:DUF1839 family protein [Ramlibacter sp.]HZY19062.1 DUF1839 family protein [Ramlibacter sp.]